MRLVPSWGLAMLFVVTGCGGGSGTDADGGTLDVGRPDVGVDASAVGDTGDHWMWSLGDVTDRYCQPLADLLCNAAATTCPCATSTCAEGAPALVQRCTESYRANTPDGLGLARFDGRRLVETLERRRAYASTCTPDPTPSGARRLAVIVAGTLHAACEPGALDGVACADGDGMCVRSACVPLPEANGSCTDVCPLGLACVLGRCVPPGGDGAACASDLGCTAPLRCIDATCRALRGDGAPCARNDDCAPGHQCRSGSCLPVPECPVAQLCGLGGTCAPGRPGTCSVLGRLGETCGFPDFECEPALACSRTSETCVPRAALGEPCSDLYAVTAHPVGLGGCVDGTVCSALGVCATPIAMGATCDGSVACADGWCNGTCQPLGGAGAPCAGIGCAPGFTCDGATCVTVAAAGGHCTSFDGCEPGSYCELSTQTCSLRRGAGEICTPAGECAAGLVCLPLDALAGGAAICTTPRLAGDDCAVGALGACGDPSLRCTAPPGPCSCTL